MTKENILNTDKQKVELTAHLLTVQYEETKNNHLLGYNNLSDARAYLISELAEKMRGAHTEAEDLDILLNTYNRNEKQALGQYIIATIKDGKSSLIKELIRRVKKNRRPLPKSERELFIRALLVETYGEGLKVSSKEKSKAAYDTEATVKNLYNYKLDDLLEAFEKNPNKLIKKFSEDNEDARTFLSELSELSKGSDFGFVKINNPKKYRFIVYNMGREHFSLGSSFSNFFKKKSEMHHERLLKNKYIYTKQGVGFIPKSCEKRYKDKELPAYNARRTELIERDIYTIPKSSTKDGVKYYCYNKGKKAFVEVDQHKTIKNQLSALKS